MIKNNRGLTLVEVIVALALLSIIMTLTFSTMLFGVKSFNAQSDDIDNLSSTRNAMSYITKEIRKAETIEITNDVITLNQTDVYQLENDSILKNGKVLISNINYFSVVKTSSKIDIEISGGDKSKLSSTIYIR